jgi:hypothetical protein
LNRFALKNGALHVFNHFLLSLAQCVVSQLHSVDFFSHSHNFSLPNSGVEGILHLLFQLNFSLPQEDLSLRLHNLSQDLSLLLFLLRDIIFKLDALVL